MMSQKNEAKIFNILLTKLLIRVERNNLSAKKTRREEVSIKKNLGFIFYVKGEVILELVYVHYTITT